MSYVSGTELGKRFSDSPNPHRLSAVMMTALEMVRPWRPPIMDRCWSRREKKIENGRRAEGEVLRAVVPARRGAAANRSSQRKSSEC